MAQRGLDPIDRQLNRDSDAVYSQVLQSAISHLIDIMINTINITISHRNDNQRASEEVVSIEHTGLSVFVLHCRKNPFGSRRTDEPGL
jgi:hypothetical protein